MTKSRNIKFGIILSYAVLLVSLIGTLTLTNRTLDLIGDYNYGLLSFVNSIATWLSVISAALTASFLRYTTMEAKERKGDVSRTNTLYLIILSILALIVVAIGIIIIGVLYLNNIPFLNYDLKNSATIYKLFFFSILNIGLTMPTSIFALYISYKERFIFQKIVNILSVSLNFCGQFLIAYLTKNVILICAFSIFVTLFNFCFNFIYSKLSLNIRFSKVYIRENLSWIKEVSVFSSILLFNTIVDQINLNVDKTLLGIFSVPENVTIYQMGQQFPSYLTTMSVAVSGVFAPTIHLLCRDEKKDELDMIFSRISKIQTIVLCFVVFGFLSCGYEFVRWWIGDSRIKTFYVAALLMLIEIGPLTMNSSIEIQRALNKHKFRAAIYFIFALVNIAISIIFLLVLPAEHAIAACLIGTIFSRICSHWIAMNIYNKKVIRLPIRKYLTTLLKYAIIGFICIVPSYIAKFFILDNSGSLIFNILIEGGVFTILYVISVFVIDKKFVFSLFRNKTI